MALKLFTIPPPSLSSLSSSLLPLSLPLFLTPILSHCLSFPPPSLSFRFFPVPYIALNLKILHLISSLYVICQVQSCLLSASVHWTKNILKCYAKPKTSFECHYDLLLCIDNKLMKWYEVEILPYSSLIQLHVNYHNDHTEVNLNYSVIKITCANLINAWSSPSIKQKAHFRFYSITKYMD